MSDHPETPWRGRLRLSTSQRTDIDGSAPLSDAERDAVDGWLPKGARIVAHTRGRSAGSDRPLWLVTSEGVLIASLSEEADGHLRARVNWVPVAQLRRVDLITNSTVALVRLLTPTRRFVLFGSNEDSATRFTVFARSLITADREGRQHTRRFQRAPLLTVAMLGLLMCAPAYAEAQPKREETATRPLRIGVFDSRGRHASAKRGDSGPLPSRLRQAVRNLRISGGYDLLIDLGDQLDGPPTRAVS